MADEQTTETETAPEVETAHEVAPEVETAPETHEEKPSNRAAYEARKAREESEKLRKELDGYKRREEEARKAKLSEEQRIKEELEQFRSENERLKTEGLKARVGAEFKLPAALTSLLIGSDEDGMRAHAEELSKLLPRPRAGSPTDPLREAGSGVPTYTRAQLQADVKLAQKVGAMKPGTYKIA